LLDLDLKAAEVVVVIVEAPGGGAREANGMSFKGETTRVSKGKRHEFQRERARGGNVFDACSRKVLWRSKQG
jgi:hypothetical protein